MYKKAINSWWKHWDFILIDLVCLQLAFILAYLFRNGMGLPYEREIYRSMAIYLILLDIIVTLFNESYKGILRRGYYREFYATVIHVSYVAGLSGILLLLTKSAEDYSRIMFLIVWGMGIVLSYIARLFRKHQLKTQLTLTDKNARYLLIICNSDETEQIANRLRRTRHEEFKVCGFCVADNKECDCGKDIEIVCDIDNVLNHIHRNQIDEVLISLPDKPELEEKLMNGCLEMGIVAHIIISRLQELKGEKQVIQKVANYTVLSRSIKIASPRELFVKRLMDIVGGLVGVVATGILFIFIAPMIFIKSPGPIFFTQYRVGKNGRKFKIYKFRSMYMDAEERKAELLAKNKMKDGYMFKMENDPRIIGGENGKGIGNFIRDTSIDEFPQFFNVLKGDMSLVGTRPPTVDEWEIYEPHHRKRMAIKPGLTGMWQISGRSEIIDFEEVVKLDTEYIAGWNLGLDIKIMLKTVKVVLTRKGSL